MTYYYRLYDYYASENIVRLVVLADSEANWRPDRDENELAGCRVSITFPTVKLLDLEASLDRPPDLPIKRIVRAHLSALKARGNPELMFQEKRALILALRTLGYNKEQILHLYKVVDYFMQLPEQLESKIQELIHEVEDRSEWPLTSLERSAIRRGYLKGFSSVEKRGFKSGSERGLKQGLKQGLEQGLEQGLIAVLQARFGVLTPEVGAFIKDISSVAILQALYPVAVQAESIDEFLSRARTLMQTSGGQQP